MNGQQGPGGPPAQVPGGQPAPAQVPGGHQPWGIPNQLKAGRANGPMHIYDPHNLLNTPYRPGPHNNEVLRNIKKSLKHPYRVGNSTLSRFMFTPSQEHYILQHLLHTNIAEYNRLMNTSAQNTFTDTYSDMPK